MKMIEPIQIQLLHIAKTQLGLSRDEYEAAIAAQTKGEKQSSKELTYFEADELINYFKTLGFTIKRKYHTPDRGNYRRSRVRRGKLPYNVTVLPSIDQMEMIEALASKIVWRFEDGYQRWLAKYMKLKRITTSEQASNTIEGLKKMLKHSTQGA